MDNGTVYDYNTAGFDKFFSRSVDNAPQQNLDSPGYPAIAQRYDDTQVSGALGDIYRVGDLLLNGKNGTISLSADQATLFNFGSLENGPGFSIGDGNNIRLFAGQDQSGNIKIKLSQTDHDADTASDDELIWSSDFNSFKIVKTGTLDFSTTAHSWASNNGLGIDSAQIAHGLGFAPLVIAFFTTSAGSAAVYTPVGSGFSTSISNGANGSVVLNDIVTVTVDSLYLYATVQQFGFYWGTLPGGNINPAETFHIKYYLIRETAAP